MTSTVVREQMGMIMEQQMNEVDSESSSSGEDRETGKRLRDEVGNNCSPKKRRKQTTPVRFPTSLMSNSEDRPDFEYDEDDDDEEENAEETTENGENGSRANEEESLLLEGKPRTISPQAYARNITGRSSVGSASMLNYPKDENLNLNMFEEKDTRHLESEHAIGCDVTLQVRSNGSPLSGEVRVKQEVSSQSGEDPESPVNLSGLGIKNFAANWLGSQSQMQQVQLQQSQNPEDWTSSVTSVPNHLQALSFPGALAQYLPLPGFPLTDPGQLVRPPMGPTPIRIFNPDAYCDLCNKEFCNKYFLKTHKANKHGIYVDGPCQNQPGEIGMPGAIFAGAFPGNPIKTEQSPRVEVPTPINVSTLGNTVPCDVCQKRFKNDESLKKHKQKVHNDSLDSQESHSLPATMGSLDEDREPSGNSPGAMEALFKQEFGVEQEDTKFMPAPRHLSPQSSQQARDSGFNVDRLRRLGVINPEAFCEICCKEYCNKYFLRTHKMKRHGIFVQENEKGMPAPGSMSWHQIQTSPLNLIVSDSNTANYPDERPGEDFECKPCGIRFQTLGLFRAHCAKIHEPEEEKSPKRESETDPNEQRTDSISEDLQKLQTMILQLNGLEASKALCCGICGKECENLNTLKTHMRQDHGGIGNELVSIGSQSNETNGTSTFCTICEKEYQTPEALRQHITEEHRSSPTNSVSATSTPQISVINPSTISQTSVTSASVTISVPSTGLMQATSTTPQPERKITSMTPTSSYCELCRKELCNKYFMKTHMQKMHNIEIENGSQIGGVVCNICNKELCSKYFLRVHKQNTHGIVDETTATAANKQESFESSSNEDPALKPDQLGDLSHRYFTHFTEVCPVCSRRFRSIKWLKAHLLGDHGKAGIDKWRELEHQYQNSSRQAGRGTTPVAATANRPGSQNSSLKIPNGLEIVQQQIKNSDYVGLGNQVLSSLFGSTAEDQQAKSYRCSYCNFTTPVLPFLFLHERSHTSPQESNPGSSEAAGTILCPVCSQAFVQPELLHHHLLTRHQFSGLLSQFPGPLLSGQRLDSPGNIEKSNDVSEKPESDMKDERHQSPQASALSNSETSKKGDDSTVQVTPQGAYKCAQCGYATANLNRIKKHVRKDHKSMGDATESVIDELSKTLRDVANKHKLPASYAMPQDMNSNADGTTVMQPFVIEEREIGRLGEEPSQERRFAPALVYLPVRARINSSLTTSFTLSPA